MVIIFLPASAACRQIKTYGQATEVMFSSFKWQSIDQFVLRRPSCNHQLRNVKQINPAHPTIIPRN